MLKVNAGVVAGKKLEKARARIDALSKMLNAGDGARVAVGLPQDSTPYPDGTSVLMVGFWMEFGTKYSPERSFLRDSVLQYREQWIGLARKLQQKAIKESRPISDFLPVLGQQMQIDVQTKIDSGPWEPNQGDYALWKQAEGKTKPLIVSGHLRASIRYVVRT